MRKIHYSHEKPEINTIVIALHTTSLSDKNHTDYLYFDGANWRYCLDDTVMSGKVSSWTNP